MATFKDKIQSSVEIDGKQAINELGKLELEYSQLRNEQKALTKDVKEYEKQVKRLESLDPGTKAFERTKKKVDELSKAQEEYQKITKGLEASKKRIDEVRKSTDLAAFSLRQLEKFQRDLIREGRNLSKNSARFKEVKDEVLAVNRAIAAQRTELKGTALAFEKVEKKASSFRDSFVGNLAADVAQDLGRGALAALDNFAKVDDQITDIQKKLGEAGNREIAQKISFELEEIDTRTTVEELREIAITAGSFGISPEGVVSFTEEVNKATVALGDEFTGGAKEVST